MHFARVQAEVTVTGSKTGRFLQNYMGSPPGRVIGSKTTTWPNETGGEAVVESLGVVI